MKKNTRMSNVITDFLYQALETEKGGVLIYTTALRCVINKDLEVEWNRYLEQTKTHVQTLTNVLNELGLNADAETPGRRVVRYLGTSLVKTMEAALRGGDREAAQLVAAECIVHAETRDHLNWQLIGELLKKSETAATASLRAAYEQIEPEEDEHLYHTIGWARELWIQAFGLPAVLPPPEERDDVDDAVEAAQSKKNRAQKAASR